MPSHLWSLRRVRKLHLDQNVQGTGQHAFSLSLYLSFSLINLHFLKKIMEYFKHTENYRYITNLTDILLFPFIVFGQYREF